MAGGHDSIDKLISQGESGASSDSAKSAPKARMSSLNQHSSVEKHQDGGKLGPLENLRRGVFDENEAYHAEVRRRKKARHSDRDSMKKQREADILKWRKKEIKMNQEKAKKRGQLNQLKDTALTFAKEAQARQPLSPAVQKELSKKLAAKKEKGGKIKKHRHGGGPLRTKQDFKDHKDTVYEKNVKKREASKKRAKKAIHRRAERKRTKHMPIFELEREKRVKEQERYDKVMERIRRDREKK